MTKERMVRIGFRFCGSNSTAECHGAAAAEFFLAALHRWMRTVCSAMPSSFAIALFESPEAAKRQTSNSLGVSALSFSMA